MKRSLPLATVGVALALLCGSAGAAPTPSPSPVQEPEDPIRVEITEILPRAPRPGGVVQVIGRLRNTGTRPVTDLRVRLRVGERITTRGELHEADNDRPPTDTKSSTPLATPTLEPGGATPFDVRIPVASLGLTRLGVYPLDIVARGNAGEGIDNLGLSPTWLPYFGAVTPKPTRVAVLWPLIDRPHLTPEGKLGDDALAVALSARGRLGRLIAAGGDAQIPRCDPAALGPTGAPEPPPLRCEPVPVTYAVDPDLLDAVAVMRTPYTVGGKPGSGTAAANAWLANLRAAGLADRLLSLPYGDPDLTALARENHTNDDIAKAARLGVEVTTAILGTAPLTQVAWPPSGSVTPDAAEGLALGGASSFVLDPTAYDDNGRTPDRTPGTRSAFTTSSTGSALLGLVIDPGLSELVTGVHEAGPRVAEQRFLAESAIIAAEAPGLSRTLLLAPARRTDLNQAGATAALRDLGRVPWLCPVALSAVAAANEQCANEVVSKRPEDTSRGSLRAESGNELAAGFLGAVAHDRDLALQLTDHVLSPEGTAAAQVAILKGQLSRAVARAESSIGREDAAGARHTASLLHERVTGLASDLVVRGGRALLTSDKGRLSVSIENTLTLPVQVRVRFTSKTATLSTRETDLVSVAPGHAVQASVKAEAQRSGQFVVFAQIVDRNGQTFGPETEIIVRSTRFGRLTLAVTIAAFAILMLAAGFRIVRHWHRARRG